MQICQAVHEILANKTFTVTNGLISWFFVVTFVHPTYMQIALIWGFSVQLSLRKSVHWLWRYKLNEVCNTPSPMIINEEEEYKVEKVWKHRKHGRGMQYLVYWKGYGDEHNQWIAETGLPHAKEAIEDYWSRISSLNL